MKKIITLALLLVSFLCRAQTSETNYYYDEGLTQKFPKNKAWYTETITNNVDGTKNILITDTKKGTVLRNETFKGTEPIGKWTLLKSGTKQPLTLDYDFTIVYGDLKQRRPDSSDFINTKTNAFPLKDNDSIGYKAPKIASGEQSMGIFIQKNIAYPFIAITQETQGTVYVRFVITETGSVEDIEVVKGAKPILDKEAVRLARLVKFASGPILNGVNKKLLLVLPITFKMEY